VMLAGFDFGTSPSASRLTGKLAALKEYNGLEIPEGYFPEAMERLRNKFLNVPLDVVLQPASQPTQQVTKEQEDKAPRSVIPEPRDSKIFISYRRTGSRYQAREIYKAFCAVLPPDNIFMDVNSIPPGADFVEVLEQWVSQCEIMLALISPDWIDAIDPKTGRKRLDNPNDFVRIEVGAALKRGIPVVPVLLDGAAVPDRDQLPDDLKNLARRNAEFVDYRTFDDDVKRLITKLRFGRR
jgi:TIR domain